MKSNKEILATLLSCSLMSVSAAAAVEDSTTLAKVFENQKIEISPMLKSQTLKTSTASVSTVEADDLSKSSALSIRNALFGKVLGLTALQGSGSIWDESAGFNIRGLQSTSGNGTIVLVDGFQRPIDDLSIEEVESVTVLRDAAAVALYGYRGVNGVVLVTTKRGKSNSRLQVKVNLDHGFSWATNLPKFVNAYTYAKAMNEAYANDGNGVRYTPFEVEAYRTHEYPNQYADVDWWDEVMGKAGHYDIDNISFMGGGKNVNYYVMFNLLSNSGFFKDTETNDGYSNQNIFSQANIRANLDIKLSKRSKLKVDIFGKLAEYNHSHYGTVMDNLYTVPAAAYPIMTEDGIWSGNTTWAGQNPVANLKATGYDRSHSRTLMANATYTQDLDFITPGLGCSLSVAYDNTSTFWEIRSKSYKYAYDAMVIDEDGNPTGEISRWEGGADNELSFTKNMNGPMYYRANAQVNVDYDREFGNHSVYSSLIGKYYHAVGSGRNNTYNYVDYTSYTRYAYKKRYMADLVLTLNAANNMPSGHKYAFSPTLSLGWMVSDESFMKNCPAINMLKLRGSLGALHVNAVPAWNLTDAAFGTGGGYYFGNNQSYYEGYTEGRVAANYFKPEQAIMYNMGIDMAFLNDFSFTGDFFLQNRNNISIASGGTVSSVFGNTPSYSPIGEVHSWGCELGLDYKKQWGDSKVELGCKYTFSRSKIIEDGQGPVAEEYMKHKGNRVSQTYGLEAIGFFADEDDIVNSPVQMFGDVKPGDIKYKDQNGDNRIDGNDVVKIGYATSVPEAYFSFNGGFEYKNVGFSFLFQGISNRSVWLGTKGVYRPLAGNCNLSQFYYDNRWTPEHKDALFPRLTSESNNNNNQSSTLWLADGSYLKLRNCEIYYKLPVALVRKIHASNARIYVRAMDLLSFDKMDVFDPEVVGTSYPTDSSVHIGLNVTF